MNKYHEALMIGSALLLCSQTLYAAQFCNSSIIPTAPDSRYTDNSDGTVTDNQTGLMWKQCSEGQSTTPPCDIGTAVEYTWQEALAQAKTVNSAGFAGHDDWRLPNHKELSSLVEMACYAPAINENHFPNTQASYYWSSSPVAAVATSPDADRARFVHFHSGGDGNHGKFSNYYVRLVRGGQ